MKTSVAFAALSCFAIGVYAGGLPELTERAYVAGHNDKGVVLLHIDWARKWGCAGAENAQVQELEFTKMINVGDTGLKPTDITLTFKNGLLANNGFEGYALFLILESTRSAMWC